MTEANPNTVKRPRGRPRKNPVQETSTKFVDVPDDDFSIPSRIIDVGDELNDFDFEDHLPMGIYRVQY